MPKSIPPATHAVKRRSTGDYHVDSQEWSQVDKDQKMANVFTERGAKKRATQLNKYHDATDWEAVPHSGPRPLSRVTIPA